LGRSNGGGNRTTLSCNPDKIRKTGQKRDAILTQHFPNGAKRVSELEKVLPNLRHKPIIDGADHWVQQERPDEVNAALIAFLKS